MAYSYLTHEYSKYPDELIKLHKFKDIDDSIKDVFDEYMSYYNEGDYQSAIAVLKKKGVDLNAYTVSARDVNTIVEELRNAQIEALTMQQVIYVQETEPLVPERCDVWVGGA